MIRFLPTVCSLATCVATAYAEPPATAPQSQPAQTQMGLKYAWIYVPPSVRPDEVAWWAHMLNLSESQRLAVVRLFEEFQSDDIALRNRELPTIWEESAAIAAANDRQRNPVTAERFVRLLAERTRVVQSISALENRLLDRIELLLAEVQQPALDRVRDLRSRIRSAVMPQDYPGAQFDLIVVLYRSGLGNRFEPLDDATFRTTLESYEKQFTPLYVRHERERIELLMRSTQYFASVEDKLPNPNDPDDVAHSQARAESVLAGYLTLGKEVRRISKQLLEINDRFAGELAAGLPIQGARAFLSAYRSSAYPSIYPNPFDISDVLDEAQSLATLSPDQRAAIDAYAAMYKAQEASISSKLVERYSNYWDQYLERRVLDYAALGQYKQDLTALQNQRARIAEQTIEQFKPLLDPEQSTQIAKAIESFRERAAAHKPMELGVDFRP